MKNTVAHTAEHAFIGSLQKILGATLAVRKVEHREDDNSVFIKTPKLDLQTVIRAELDVNSLISNGRDLKTHIFESLDKARTLFPSLRANEERIKQQYQPVRIIEIQGHDVAACAMDHVSNIRECEFFLVTNFSATHLAGETEFEINFAVQNQAKEASIMMSQKMLQVCQELGANINTIENTVKKLNNERSVNALKLKRLTLEHLVKIEANPLYHKGKVNLIQDVLYGLDQGEIQRFAGEMTSRSDDQNIILLAHLSDNNEENALVVFARSKSLEHIDCNRLFNQYSYLGTRGGGKPSFVTGIVRKENINLLMEKLTDDARKIVLDGLL
jgi:alanyl-tRNA synthetase